MAANPPEPPASLPGDPEDRYRRIRDETLAEFPARWKSCLYHPAWTVAAALLLAGAFLVHFRRSDSPERRTAAAPARPAAAREVRDRLPASSRPGAAPPPATSTAPPNLAQAVALFRERPAPEAEIVLMLNPAEPPELVRRPRPVDVETLTLDLAALAGLQIGGGDWEDAGRVIGMLGRYAPGKANELSSLLASVRSAASSAPAPREIESAAPLENSKPEPALPAKPDAGTEPAPDMAIPTRRAPERIAPAPDRAVPVPDVQPSANQGAPKEHAPTPEPTTAPASAATSARPSKAASMKEREKVDSASTGPRPVAVPARPPVIPDAPETEENTRIPLMDPVPAEPLPSPAPAIPIPVPREEPPRAFIPPRSVRRVFSTDPYVRDY